MIKIFNVLACIFFISELTAEQKENVELSEKSSDEKKETSTGEIVIYKDRCVINTSIKAAGKNQKVPGSIDSQSILFSQASAENPEYELIKESKEATEAELLLSSKNPFVGNLAYSFTGINWHMHYVVELNETFSEILKFNGFISIDNESGCEFKNVQLLLVDGMTDSQAKSQTSFYEYKLDTPQTLKKHCVIRIPWVNLSNQKTEQDYRFEVGGDNFLKFSCKKSIPLQVFLSFKQKLGRDIANGDITLYVRDKSDTLRFLGMNHIDSSKSEESVQFAIPLHLVSQLISSENSPHYKVTGVLEQTDFKTLLTEELDEIAYRLTINNYGDKEITIKVTLHPGEANVKVVRESNNHQDEKENVKNIYWTIKIEPNSEVMLRYRIQVKKK